MFKSRLSRKQRKELKEIKSYNLDWQDFYRVNNLESNLSPEEFFILNVWNGGLIVPKVLDVDFYFNHYADLQLEQVNPLIHYMRYGRYENRQPFPEKKTVIPKLSKTQIEHDFSVIAKEKIDWQSYIKVHSLSSKNEAIAHYATYWPVLLPEIEGVIDSKYYVDEYPDIWERGDNPLVHYLTHGKAEGRNALPIKDVQTSESDYDVDAVNKATAFPICEFETKLRSLRVNWSLFSDVNNLKSEPSDPVNYIIENQEDMMISIHGFFDSKLYLELYSDIAKASISPLRHFLFHGKAEGRIGYFDLQKHYKLGSHTFDEVKPLFVVVSHESSATGAPLVGFNLSQQLEKHANVVNIVLRKSKLQNAFQEQCIASISDLHVQSPVLAKKALQYISGQFKNIDGVICNSVETAYVLQAANELEIPTVSLVHEFSEYTRPIGKITDTVFNADRVVVPAQAIKDSMCRELKSFRGVKDAPNNITIQPQGRLPFIPEGHGNLDSINTLKAKLGLDDSTDSHVLVAAGYVQIRKGVDLFVSAAKRIKELTKNPCKFVWVGEGYEPNTDLNYANWVQTQITLNGLEKDVVFLGHQRNLDNVMQLADVFCMTSRLDPFPNVVIDALDADVHVACFEQSTGCAQFLKEHEANATVAPYLDIEQFSKGVSAYLNTDVRYENKNKQIVSQHLDFECYTQAVLDELKKASEFRKQVMINTSVIEKSNLFDARFYDPSLSPEQAIKEYVQLGLKGIHLNNPKPGFNERLWLANFNDGSPFSVALTSAVETGNIKTHEIYHLCTSQVPSRINYKYAIHLHLFYPDLAEEFAQYFKSLPEGYDLFITHLDLADTDHITSAFSSCGANKVETLLIENKGRNLGAFVDTFKKHIAGSNYEVIGHLQSKKSIAIDGGMGERWRKFLLDTLIGSPQQAEQILALFNNDKLGIVFPEDRHCVDSADNRLLIKNLYEKLGINASVDCYLFPIGSMFWARVNSLLPLVELEEKFYKYDEPMPYDGTYLHALERILPIISKTQGYEEATVHRTGVNW